MPVTCNAWFVAGRTYFDRVLKSSEPRRNFDLDVRCPPTKGIRKAGGRMWVRVTNVDVGRHGLLDSDTSSECATDGILETFLFGLSRSRPAVGWLARSVIICAWRKNGAFLVIRVRDRVILRIHPGGLTQARSCASLYILRQTYSEYAPSQADCRTWEKQRLPPYRDRKEMQRRPVRVRMKTACATAHEEYTDSSVFCQMQTRGRNVCGGIPHGWNASWLTLLQSLPTTVLDVWISNRPCHGFVLACVVWRDAAL